MAEHASPGGRAWGLASRIVLSIALGLTTFVLVVVLSARPIPADAALDLSRPGDGGVCFYRGGYPYCVERRDPLLDNRPDVLSPELLLSTLLLGPTQEERRQGIVSALPVGTRLASVEAEGLSVTVRLLFPQGYLTLPLRSESSRDLSTPGGESWTPDGAGEGGFSPLAVEAIDEQIVGTLFPLGYRHFLVLAKESLASGPFRPLAAYLPPIEIPAKAGVGAEGGVADPTAGSAPDAPTPQSGQPPVERLARPQGALSGKTIYVSAGHGWRWTGSDWTTQRPPYPDGSTGYYGPIIEDHNNAEIVNQYLLRYLWNAGADVWTVRERDMNSFKQIVDDTDISFGTLGVWESTTGGGYLSRYLWTTTDWVATAAVTWTLGPVVADGLYGLYVWYPSATDSTRDARYVVRHAGGVTELQLDQRHHGSTWRYVGRFPLRAGESLHVSLNNRSDAPGRPVVADAVRMGGGWFTDGDLASNGGPVKTDAPYAPAKPWWETAAYYNVQRLGLDPDHFPVIDDIIARPLWARWEHADSGEDAIYVSWHSNGYNGHNSTVWGTVSYIHSFQSVPGSAALRHAVHQELINDARAGWDPNWRDLGEASRDLGELRELWDETASNAIPGVLIEVAYHDHDGDADALKDPRFALLSARAVYQGIVKYFGEGLTLLPEPPTHLQARNAGPGQVWVSWRPSPTDDVGLVGDAAETYRLYSSRDGFAWDAGRAVAGTQALLDGLQAGELLFVRVTAVNAGGESFPTPTLAVRSSVGGQAQILLVDGFDRIDRHGLILEDDPVEGINARMFPDRINRFDYMIQHGESITFPFDSAVNEAVGDGDLDLGQYRIVDWILGEESTVDRTFDPAEQAIVAGYLEGGGGLFVSGAEIGWDLATQANGQLFFQTYLGADMVGDDAGSYVVVPTSAGIFAGLGTIPFREAYDVDYPDQLAPRAGSLAALDYLGGAGGVAAVQYEAGGCRRVVYFGFPFETIDPLWRSAVMGRVLAFLGRDGCLVTEPQTTITTPVSGAAFNEMPAFGGTAQGINGVARVEVRIKDPGGRFWDGSQWLPISGWLTADGDAIWSYSLALVTRAAGALTGPATQGQYELWGRAWDTAGVADSTPASVTFLYDTIPPESPALVAPPDGITFTGAPGRFVWLGPANDTGSALGYHFQIDSRIVTLAVTNHLPLAWPTSGPHLWRVRTFDAAGNLSPWSAERSFVMRTYDFHLPVVYRAYEREDLTRTVVDTEPSGH
jgi:N-acetylmuramoyl-L-alanine amidase